MSTPAATPLSADSAASLTPTDVLSSLSPSAADRKPVATPLTSQPAEEPIAAAETQPSPTPTATRAPLGPLPSRLEEPAATQDRSTRIREAPKPKPAPVRHTVEQGDNFYSIARDHYGDDRYWTLIRDANPDANPNRLLVGQTLILPPKEEASAQATPTTTTPPTTTPALTYTVGAGDSLTSIARNVLGDGSRWREIYELNRDKLNDPDVLHEGVVLRMPEKKK